MKKIVLTLVAAAALFGAPALAADVPKNIEFQAEFVEKDHGAVTRGKIYIADGMSRFEVEGGREIIVTRRDKKVIWLIFPRLSRYVEQEYIGEPKQVYIDPSEPAGDNLTREFLGYEWIDSYRLRKFLVTVTYPQGEDKYYEWFRDNFPVPVKMSSLDGKVSFEYLKIKIGPLDPNLFGTPKQYKKVEMEEIPDIEAGAAKGKKKK